MQSIKQLPAANQFSLITCLVLYHLKQNQFLKFRCNWIFVFSFSFFFQIEILLQCEIKYCCNVIVFYKTLICIKTLHIELNEVKSITYQYANNYQYIKFFLLGLFDFWSKRPIVFVLFYQCFQTFGRKDLLFSSFFIIILDRIYVSNFFENGKKYWNYYAVILEKLLITRVCKVLDYGIRYFRFSQ